MNGEYTLKVYPHGAAVFGSLPADEIGKLGELFAGRGWTDLCPGIASSLGATVALSGGADLATWREEVRLEAERAVAGDPEKEWILGSDTGLSSLTIFSVLSEKHSLAALAKLGAFGATTPYDPSDFGRCHRLLVAVPGWRGRLQEVADRYPKWAPLVAEWDSLTTLYLEELPTGKAPKLYHRMKEISERLKS